MMGGPNGLGATRTPSCTANAPPGGQAPPGDAERTYIMKATMPHVAQAAWAPPGHPLAQLTWPPGGQAPPGDGKQTSIVKSTMLRVARMAWAWATHGHLLAGPTRHPDTQNKPTS
jgi:hypothetical protein